MATPYEALLLLGGNRGDPIEAFAKAEALLERRAGRVTARSRDHLTEPWGFTDERLFLNRALLVESALAPTALMETLLGIEADLGRARPEAGRYGPRTIDIDILLIGGRVIHAPTLTVPHPRFHERPFALGPAADIAPGWVHPLLRKTVLE
ncbi:MAG: 2-amino-4-hydroxy-6-hydroxymethyldihydropteridine diphosphokinase [Flavobacteriales bacterium]